MIAYSKYSYLYPPRPETAIPESLISFYAKRGWHYQAKMNGTCTVIFANSDQVIYKTRHGDAAEHRQWTPLKEHNEFFQSISQNGWNVFVAELLHNKTPNIKNKLYVFDQIVQNGNYLVDYSFLSRQEILAMSINGFEQELWFEQNEFIVRAKTMKEKPLTFYKKYIEKSEVEGIVLKNPNATLEFCKATANGSWQVKVRRPHKNYSF